MKDLTKLTKTNELKEIANFLKKQHLSVLAKYNVEKSVYKRQEKINKSVDDYVASLGNIDNLSDKECFAIILRLCAKFKNAHLFLKYNQYGKLYKNNNKYLNNHLIYINKKVYVDYNDELLEVKSIGGVEIDTICKKMSEYLSFETNEWLNVKLNGALNSLNSYQSIGVDPQQIELKNGEIVPIQYSTEFYDVYTYFPPYNENKNAPFDYHILNDLNTIKINYRSCHEENKGDFITFVNSVKNAIEANKISTYIIDIRGNSGGSSEIIRPLIDLLKEKDMLGVVLTDNRVFSSGVFGVYYAKKYLNSTIIGQALGQGNSRFGQNSGELEISKDLTIFYTEKYFSFCDVFPNKGAIKPDIEVPLTITDLRKNFDRTLEVAKQYIIDNILTKNSLKP